MVDLRKIVEVAPASNVAEIARIALEDFGQHNAIVMPLTDLSSGRCSSLSLWGEGPRTDFKAFAQARVGALQMAGLHLRALFDVRWPLDAAAPREAARLSDRERQVLAALAAGAQTAAIADRLAITERST